MPSNVALRSERSLHKIMPKGVMKRIKDLIDGIYDASAAEQEREEARIESLSEKQLVREIDEAAAARDRLAPLKKKVFGIEAAEL